MGIFVGNTVIDLSLSWRNQN